MRGLFSINKILKMGSFPYPFFELLVHADLQLLQLLQLISIEFIVSVEVSVQGLDLSLNFTFLLHQVSQVGLRALLLGAFGGGDGAFEAFVGVSADHDPLLLFGLLE